MNADVKRNSMPEKILSAQGVINRAIALAELTRREREQVEAARDLLFGMLPKIEVQKTETQKL